jgi:tetratricopeptide (TPR) repeat protein
MSLKKINKDIKSAKYERKLRLLKERLSSQEIADENVPTLLEQLHTVATKLENEYSNYERYDQLRSLYSDLVKTLRKVGERYSSKEIARVFKKYSEYWLQQGEAYKSSRYSERQNQLLQKGKMEFERKNFRKALPHFKMALKIAEENHDNIGTSLTLYAIGNLFIQMKDYQQALSIFKRLEELDPQGTASFAIADILFVLGRNDESLQHYDHFFMLHSDKSDPNYSRALNNKGCVLTNLGKDEEAIKCYDKAIEIDPSNAEIWTNKCGALFNLGRDKEAIKCLDKVIEIKPDFALASTLKGYSLERLGKRKQAIMFYDKAIAIDPNYSLPWNNKGSVLNNLGKYEEAMKCLNKAIAIDPNYSLPWNNKGYSLMNLKKYEEAIKCYDKAIEIDPNYHDACNSKGVSLCRLKKYEEAIKCYDKAIEIDPNDSVYYCNKGDGLNDLGKYEEAIKCFDKAIEIDPNYSTAWNDKGYSLERLGKHKQAIMFYDKARDKSYLCYST